MVGDRVLHAQRHEIEALHRAAMRVGLDLERALGGEVVAPAHLLRLRVDVVLVAIREARDAPEDAARDARVQVRLVHEVEGSGESDAGLGGLGMERAEANELLGEDAGEAARAGREERLAQNGFTTTRITITTRRTVGISFTQR